LASKGGLTSKLKIICDTREQKPLIFSDKVEVIRQCLPAGDYSTEKLMGRVGVERKALGDLINTIIHNKERFAKELDKTINYDYFCIVCEASIKDLLSGCYRSRAAPQSILAICCSIIAGRRIPIFFMHDRACASVFIEGLLKECERKYCK
jgi:ERCC4-type nuclease